MLLAVDPGQNSPGAAMFGNDKQLVAATRANTSEYADLPDGERWLRVARVLSAWVGKYTGGPERALSVVYELPQVYQRSKSKGDPNQLIGIAGVACNLTGILSCRFLIDVATPNPADWIGQISKECPDCKYRRGALKGTGVRTLSKNCKNCHGSAWETPRGRYIRKRLHADELALVPDQNDAIDAVGIGLWALGRLTPYQVFSNGRDGR